MKILNIFNHYLEQGGEEHAVNSITQSLTGIVDLQRCDFYSKDWLGNDAPAIWKQAIWMFHNPESLRKIRTQQRNFHADAWLLHNIFPTGSAAIYAESERQGIPIIQYIHNFRPFSVSGYLWANDRLAPEGLKKNFWPEIRTGAWQNSQAKTAWLALIFWSLHFRGAFDSVKAWIAISDFLRNKFVEAGIPGDRIFTLRHFWKPRPHSSHRTSSEHFLYLGRLTEAKGILVLIKAWEILEARLGRTTPRLLIGGDGPLHNQIADRTSRIPSIVLAGQLSGDAKDAAFRGARAVIVPSLCWEGLGLVVYEAYDQCLPVLVARSGGLPEIVAESKTGLIHEPGDAEQLANQVLELMDAEKTAEMGRNGRDWLEKNADENTWQRKFFEITQRVTSTRN